MKQLKIQLSFAIMLVVFVTVALISLFANLLINKQFETYIMEQQKIKAFDIAKNLSGQYNGLTNAWGIDLLHTIGMYALSDGYIIKIYDKTGESVWDAENHDTALCAQVMEDVAARMRRHGSKGEFVSQEYALTQNGQKIGTATIRYYGPFFLSENDFSFLDSLNVILLIIGTFSLLFSFFIGWLLARRIARPVTKTANIAKQIADGNYAIQFVGETKTQELHDLVSAINHLAAALERQESLRKQLTADIAHELRTPIATIGTHLEAMIEKVWEPTPERLKSCHEEIFRLGKIVADLERLEKAESDSLTLIKSDIDLFELARTICASYEGELANKNLSLTIEGESSVISIDKDRMSRVISNLMSNAVKYTPENGRIKIYVQDNPDNSILTVEDSGIGIEENEIPFIFERFYRSDKSRSRNTGGAGIGLAIVKSIISTHEGEIMVQSKINHGSSFIITLSKNTK